MRLRGLTGEGAILSPKWRELCGKILAYQVGEEWLNKEGLSLIEGEGESIETTHVRMPSGHTVTKEKIRQMGATVLWTADLKDNFTYVGLYNGVTGQLVGLRRSVFGRVLTALARSGQVPSTWKRARGPHSPVKGELGNYYLAEAHDGEKEAICALFPEGPAWVYIPERYPVRLRTLETKGVRKYTTLLA